MRIAVTGSAGLFGHGLVQVFGRAHEVFPLTRAEADLTRPEDVREVLARIRPDVVIHPAGIPDPDLCETQPAQAFQVNVHGTRNVVTAAQSVGAAVAYISSDAVFDGEKRTPYLETDDARPPSVYGRSKLLGERAVEAVPEHWIFRVSVVFGPGKVNFVDKVIRAARDGHPTTVAADQVGQATYTLDAARSIEQLIISRQYGVYHLANSGQCSRLELAQHALALAGLDPSRALGVPAAQMGRPAKRLLYSVMAFQALERAGMQTLRPWTAALAEYLVPGHASSAI